MQNTINGYAERQDIESLIPAEEQAEFNVHETDAAAKEGSEIKLNTATYYTEGAVLLVFGLIFTYLVKSLGWYQIGRAHV